MLTSVVKKTCLHIRTVQCDDAQNDKCIQGQLSALRLSKLTHFCLITDLRCAQWVQPHKPTASAAKQRGAGRQNQRPIDQLVRIIDNMTI